MMRKSTPAANPEAYVAALSGWQRDCVEQLRAAVLSVRTFEEVVKWGHLVYFHQGPALLIRAEESRVLFGFWRGQRLTALEPRLAGSGKYEMATIQLRECMTVTPATARRLARAAAALNDEFGDPTAAAKPARRRTPPRTKK